MIAISGVLVLVAIGLLVTGLVLPNLWFVYASIVVSLASAVCLVVGVFIGRGQGPTPRTATASGKDARSKASGGPTGGSAKKKTTGSRSGGRRSSGGSATATKEPAVDQELVVVVPGRLRYHLSSCRQVTGRDTEELQLAEARTQGYVACTSCRPDKVLAARAETEPPADEADEAGADGESTATAESPAEESEDETAAAEESEDDTAAAEEAEPPADESDDAADGAEEAEGESTAEDGAAGTAATTESTAEDGAAGAAATTEPAAEEPEATTEVQAVAGQRRYHLPTCQVIEDAAEDDAEVETLTLATARSRDLTPCRVCAPDDQS